MWPIDMKKLHDIYIAKNVGDSWFKIGISSKLDNRIDSLGGSTKLYHRWPDSEAWTAIYLESQAVALAKEWGFERHAEDWFLIDEGTVKVIIECITELRDLMDQWGRRHLCAESIPEICHGVPYGEYLRTQKAHGIKPELAEPVAKYDAELEAKWKRAREERRARTEAERRAR